MEDRVRAREADLEAEAENRACRQRLAVAMKGTESLFLRLPSCRPSAEGLTGTLRLANVPIGVTTLSRSEGLKIGLVTLALKRWKM